MSDCGMSRIFHASDQFFYRHVYSPLSDFLNVWPTVEAGSYEYDCRKSSLVSA